MLTVKEIINMKKIFILILVLISVQSFGQMKLYAISCNTNGTKDSIDQKFFTDSLFLRSNGVFVARTKEYYSQFFDPEYPIGFENFKQRADRIWVNDNCTVNNTTIIPPAAQTALDVKLAADGNGGSLTGLTKTQVGLSNADNTSDASKPISTATQTALNNKTTYYTGTDAGANDSYVVTLSPVPPSLTTGMIVIFRANTANTTGCTINVNGLGVTTIVKRVSTTPATGDILALQWCMLVYNGTNFVLLNPVVN